MGRKILLGLALAGLLGVAAAEDNGRIYGTVVLRDGGEVTGALRWDDEELLWLHHFNGNKAAAFDLNELAARDRELILANQPGPQIEIDGHLVELARWLGGGELRPQFFGLEFGAIAALEPGRGDQVKITLRDGSVIEADGGSNDIGSPDIQVMVGDGSVQTTDWDDIERIAFSAPATPAPEFPPHLYGRVRTDAGDFEGFVEWDQDERRASERLDGEVDGIDEEIEFGSIRSIAKEGDGSRVTLTDGEQKLVTGTNDVNSENRGIVVTGPAFGQVEIPWTAFQEVTFFSPPAELPRYADFAELKVLSGSVTGRDGRRHAGALVFDLDQFHQGECLEGRGNGVLYRIPLRLIAALEPIDARHTRVELVTGAALVLGVRNDVTEDNGGVVVRNPGREPAYLPWREVKTIEFNPPR